MEASELLEIIGDKHSTEILRILHRRELNATDIIRNTKIPPGVVYRKIHTLKNAGLIETIGRPLTSAGKRIWIFKSTLKASHIYYDGAKLKIVIEKINGQKLIFED